MLGTNLHATQDARPHGTARSAAASRSAVGVNVQRVITLLRGELCYASWEGLERPSRHEADRGAR